MSAATREYVRVGHLVVIKRIHLALDISVGAHFDSGWDRGSLTEVLYSVQVEGAEDIGSSKVSRCLRMPRDQLSVNGKHTDRASRRE